MTSNQRERLEKSLIDSFNLNDLQMMLITKLGIVLAHEVSTDNGLRKVINDLISVTEMGEWTNKLLFAAYDFRPVNRIKDIIVDLQYTPIPKPSVDEEKAIFSISDSNQVLHLERIVNKRTTFINFAAHLKALRKIGSQICRIEYPKGQAQGTGWLVGPNLVLTNYHVIEKIINNIFLPADVCCRFEFFNEEEATEATYHKLHENWKLDFSKYAMSDIGKSNVTPTFDELDYALIQLNTKPGDDSLSDSEKRGWIEIRKNTTAILPNDIMLIPQHPQGRTLEIAFGNIFIDKPYNENGTRLRYNANTDYGSSGSPCFDINLLPFGLHHAGKIKENIGFNQCVPLREITSRMERNGITPFWI